MKISNENEKSGLNLFTTNTKGNTKLFIDQIEVFYFE